MAYKTASLLVFGNRETGKIKRRELRVQTWEAHADGPGYNFTKAAQSWSCENDEIHRLQAFLNGQFPEQGVYQLSTAESAVQEREHCTSMRRAWTRKF